MLRGTPSPMMECDESGANWKTVVRKSLLAGMIMPVISRAISV